MADVGWWFGDYPLDDIAQGSEGQHAIEELATAQDLAAVRGENPEVPLREGRIFVKKSYDSRVVSLGMHITDEIRSISKNGEIYYFKYSGIGPNRP